jgi:hypothetical protein
MRFARAMMIHEDNLCHRQQCVFNVKMMELQFGYFFIIRTLLKVEFSQSDIL